MPWCIRKCPYCDFNSHTRPDNLPEQEYIDALIQDLQQDLQRFPAQEITSIFIGGGTPSLFSAAAYERLFHQLQHDVTFSPEIEITLEANPGTVEQQRFTDYRALGINRLSLGVQSFNSNHLRRLGRIHDGDQARSAIETARRAGFTNLNLDIMHTLPQQTVEQGLDDIQQALSFAPEHLSWYQLTIEPNTVFFKKKPILPPEETAGAIEEAGLQALLAHHYERYEISAFCKPGLPSRHNLNYWLFGDYYGIGAGAHGKYTLSDGTVCRTRKQRQPHDYLNPQKPFLAAEEHVNPAECVFEFMLNTTRLQQPIPYDLFTERTGLPFSWLEPMLLRAQQKGLLMVMNNHWQVTTLGRQFTNDLQALFLPE